MVNVLLLGIVNTSPNPKWEDHPLLAVRDAFAATFHIWRPFLHPQPEDAPCCGDRDSLNTGSTWLRIGTGGGLL
jgi:hypothetical protein